MTSQPAAPLPQHATPEGTEHFSSRFPDAARAGHFRQVLTLALSSIGLGTYLGDPTDEADCAYEEAITEAVRRGCNVLDSAINYRAQRSERALGRALRRLGNEGFRREELLLCTKGGFIPYESTYPRSAEEAATWVRENLVERGVAAPDEIFGGYHCMTPGYLRDQLDRSLQNLGVSGVDVYYVHNPETQLESLAPDAFYARLTEAFGALEAEAAGGRVQWYGTATWDGFREDPGSRGLMSLERVAEAARSAGGDSHRFRFIQLPVNLAMAEALTLRNQMVGGERLTLLEAAERLGITVIASGSMLQARLARGLPTELVSRLPDLPSDAARAIQFTRSVPGLTTALVGMGQPGHARENLRLANIPPVPPGEFWRVFGHE